MVSRLPPFPPACAGFRNLGTLFPTLSPSLRPSLSPTMSPTVFALSPALSPTLSSACPPLVSHPPSRCLCFFHSVSILSPTVSIVTHSVFHVIKVASEQSKTIQISMCPIAQPIFLKALLHVLHGKSCSTSVCLSQIQNFESYISFQNWIAKLDGAGP